MKIIEISRKNPPTKSKMFVIPKGNLGLWERNPWLAYRFRNILIFILCDVHLGTQTPIFHKYRIFVGENIRIFLYLFLQFCY
jgi:hypothetical protein